MFERLLEQYRRYYWLVNGALIVLVAYVIAGLSVREVMDRYVTVPAPRAPTVTAVKADRPASFSDYEVVLSRNLLNVKVEDEQVEAAPVIDDTPVRTTIQATLLGTVAGPPAHSFGIVRVSGKTEVVKVGELIGGQAEVLEIHRTWITILNNGRQEVLHMYDEDGEKVAAARPSRPARRPARQEPQQASSEVDVREVSPNEYEIPREQFEEMTSNLGPLLTQARVVPNFQDGAIDGYKIFAIQPDSVYTQIGLQNGDVIRNINGVEIDSPERALQLFQTLRTERNFSIDLARDDEPMTFNYNLR